MYDKKLIEWVKPKDSPEFLTSSSEFYIKEPVNKIRMEISTPIKINPSKFEYSRLKEKQGFGKRFAAKYLR